MVYSKNYMEEKMKETSDLSAWWKGYEETQEEKDCYKQASEYEDGREFDKAIKILDITLGKYPNNANLLNQRAMQYYFCEDFRKGLDDINRAIKIELDAACFNTRALIYEGLQQFENAVLDHNEAVNQAPDWFQARFDRATFFETQNNIEDALNDINEALKIKPEAIEAYLVRGDLYIAQNEFKNALSDYEYIINHCDDKEIIKECRKRMEEVKKNL